jgi:hypothetical protein
MMNAAGSVLSLGVSAHIRRPGLVGVTRPEVGTREVR